LLGRVLPAGCRVIELIRALAVLVEPPSEATPQLAELIDLPSVPEPWEYTDLFLGQMYPYASVYLGPEGMLGGEARDRVAGLWRALGEEPPAEPDHLSVLLGLYAHLLELELELESAATERQAQAWRRARTALLWEHLLSWQFVWLAKLEAVAPPTYGAWGRVLARTLAHEASGLTLPTELPVHLAEAPPLPEPQQDGGETFLAGLLTPVRCGFILTRTDLERAAAELRLGLRAGERRYALRALIGQDRAATLGWLAEYARQMAGESPDSSTASSPIDEFWRQRALASAARLGQAAISA